MSPYTRLKLNQRVVDLENFATGHQRNLDEVQTLANPEQWANFNFSQGDIRNLADWQKAMVFCHCGHRPAIHPARRHSITSGKNICKIGLQPPSTLRNQLHKQ